MVVIYYNEYIILIVVDILFYYVER